MITAGCERIVDMHSYFKKLKELRFGVILFLAAISLILSIWILKTPITSKIHSLMPEYVCTIKVLDEHNIHAVTNNEVWIEGLTLGNNDGIFENADKITVNNGFELRKAESFGYSCDVIVNTQGAGSELSFKWSGGDNDNISFWKQPLSGIISINITFGEETILHENIDLYSNQPEDTLVYTLNTPSNELLVPKQYVVLKWCVYILAGITLFLLLSVLIIRFVDTGDKNINNRNGSEDNAQTIVLTEKKSFYMFLKKLKLVNIIWIFLLSVIFASCFFSFVNSYISEKIQYDEVVITVKEPGTVWISNINGEEPTKEIFESAEKVGNWEFLNKTEFEDHAINHICLLEGGNDCSITLKSQYIKNGNFVFWKNSEGAVIEITHKGQTQTIDTFSDIPGGEYYHTNVRNKWLPIILMMAVIYLFLVIIIAAVIISIFYMFDVYGYKLLSNENFSSAKLVLILFVVSYAFNLINYKLIGIPNLLEFGDQSEYWYRADMFYTLLSSPHTSDQIIGFFSDYPVFRGYFCYIIPLVSIIAGDLIKIEPLYIFLLFSASITALFWGYIMPEIYKFFNNKKPAYINCILALLLFGIFWKGQFYNVLCDYPGACAFLSGSLFLIKFLKEKKIRYAVICGILFSLTLSLRTSYIVGVAAVIIVLTIIGIVHKRNCDSLKTKSRRSEFNKILAGIFAGIVCFLILCIPQIWINSTKSHVGLFAYDEIGAYDYKDTTLLESSISRSLGIVVTGYPYPINDKQIAGMRDIAGFDSELHLKMDEAFYIYASSPLDSLLAMFKRAFAIMDTKMNECYPIHSYHKHSYFYLYSTVNYLILGTALFCLINRSFRKRKLSVKEFICMGVPSIIVFAPLLAGAVEWRHGLNICILAYYLVAYYFFEVLADKKQNKLIFNSNYFRFITCYVFLSHVLSLTMYA